MTVSVPLENLAKDLWKSVDAEAENGPFSKFGIEPPDIIGTLELEIVGRPKVNTFSASMAKPRDPLAFRELISIDIGQADEAVINGVLELGANLPLSPPSLTYILWLDVDNDPATGDPSPLAPGAEFKAEASFDATSALTARLLSFNPVTQAFDIVPAGVHDASLTLDRSKVLISLALDTLGNPAGPVATWGSVQEAGVVTDLFPPAPGALAPAITISRTFNDVVPAVVSTSPIHDSVDVGRSTDICVSFTKSMNHAATEAAFSLSPPVAGLFAWQGNRVCLQPASPLAPFTVYQATIAASATDRVGTMLDGNGDSAPGDPFTWQFTTASLPLQSRDAAGNVQGRFEEGGAVYAAGAAFPGSDVVSVYVITHSRADLGSTPLADVTDDGPTPAITLADGTLPLTFLGAIGTEGEYNIVVDVDQNGTFNRTIDRIDATGIGLFVLPRPLGCDIDGDGDVDRLDASAILAARDTPATPGDPRDVNGDGRVTVADARLCTLKCTKPRCDP